MRKPSPSMLVIFREACAQEGLPLELALGVAYQESGFRQRARSRCGAIGVMQLMPRTAAGLGVDPRDLRQNIFGGVKLLAGHLREYGGRIDLTLVAYNAGPGRVPMARHDWSELPIETQHYVPNVKRWMREFKALIEAGRL